MKKIRKGDEVIVIAGKDKGKKGIILSMVDGGEKVLVEGINVAKKHTKPNPNAGERGGVVPKTMPIHRSNVMVCDSNGKGSRVLVRKNAAGKSERVFKTSGQVIDAVKE